MSKTLELLTRLHQYMNSIGKMHITKTDNPIRFGVLSAALISPSSLFLPMQTHPDAIVVAIASRDLRKAQAQAKKFSIPAAYGSYDELLSQIDVDAVYIPLPNGFHAEWAIKAMKAGKHVLIEKPLASNADQARQILECSAATGMVALEAYHWQFHPAAHVVKSIIDSGRYGNLVSTSIEMTLPAGVLARDDIRFVYDKLAGGSLMDLAYVFSATRYFVVSPGSAKFEVLSAKARLNSKDQRVDEQMDTTILFQEENGKPSVRSTVHTDIYKPKLAGIIPHFWKVPTIVIELEKARITFFNFVGPHFYHSITIYSKETGTTQTQKHYSLGPKWGPRSEPWWSTYRYQLEAFISKIRGEVPNHWVGLEESVKVMETVDAVYEKAGMTPRGL